jgi:hypothetical protein
MSREGVPGLIEAAGKETDVLTFQCFIALVPVRSVLLYTFSVYAVPLFAFTSLSYYFNRMNFPEPVTPVHKVREVRGNCATDKHLPDNTSQNLFRSLLKLVELS